MKKILLTPFFINSKTINIDSIQVDTIKQNNIDFIQREFFPPQPSMTEQTWSSSIVLILGCLILILLVVKP